MVGCAVKKHSYTFFICNNYSYNYSFVCLGSFEINVIKGYLHVADRASSSMIKAKNWRQVMII